MINNNYLTKEDFYLDKTTEKIIDENTIEIDQNIIFKRSDHPDDNGAFIVTVDPVHTGYYEIHAKMLHDINFSVMKKISSTTFENVIFANCIFSDLDLYNINFVRCVFRRSIFVNSNLSFCHFSQCNFDGSSIYDCYFSNFKLDHSGIYSSYIMRNKFRKNIITEFNNYDVDVEYIKCKSHYIPSYIQEELLNRSYISCPEEGSFIGYKKAVYYNPKKKYLDHAIVKLQIMEDSLRSSAQGRKCRTNKAKVLEITDLKGNKLPNKIKVHSWLHKDFIYKVGEIIKPDNFDECRWNECSNGIHFFLSKQEAIDYEFY